MHDSSVGSSPDPSPPARTTTSDTLRLLTAASIGEPGALDQLLARAEDKAAPAELPPGTDLLIFLCGSTPSAAPLTALRAVLPTLPPFAPLPASPAWLLGVFALHADMVGLVDPVPVLSGMGSDERYAPVLAPRSGTASSFFPAPPTGPLGLTMAVVVGDGDRTLGLAVSAIGDLVRAGVDELTLDPDELARAASPVVDRYIAGIYTPPGTTDHYTVLHLEYLVDDLLRALESPEEC